MKEIGGYFEMELPCRKEFLYSGDGFFGLNSGRHALEFILLGLDDIKEIYLPLYTCDVILEPIKRLNLKYTFYDINEQFEVEESIFDSIDKGVYIIINNYFSLKNSYIDNLLDRYSDVSTQFIIDCCQSLFYFNDKLSYCFYSPRKFVGVADGGIAYINCNSTKYQNLYESLEVSQSFDKYNHLLKRLDVDASAGYNDFKINSLSLQKAKVMQISKLTMSNILAIDFSDIKRIRNENYAILKNNLKEINTLSYSFLGNASNDGVLFYPLLVHESHAKLLREYLVKNKVFVPQFWPNIKDWCSCETVEWKLYNNIIFLPIDQRYGKVEMMFVINLINNFFKDVK
ncbi:hypothetical protein HX030_05515 [Myroides odoratimimus]|uniref:hypothetical protein n=1 Tax=Myroides odoratimimus TaxID=76832 RepID=UPI002578D0E2|nr:hypothetical protein [Myroides odoratimimus]MDM1466509.1 hypothetical protein [Myroides odoratimimus]MDM1469659.1 hypothetical protein [Myroides odoratimimus]MDM1479671.1 hypothetical protein [Myroides odoratimimus]